MGQKVNPNGFRLGINKDWKGKWYANKKDFADTLLNDINMREYLYKKLKDAAIADIVIERNTKRTNVKVYTARPGVVIGQGGKDIEKLRSELKKISGEEVYVQIVEVKNPNLNAKLVADSIAQQIENRANFRNAQKRAIRNVMKSGAQGIKTKVSGRLGGAEMARSEGYTEGTVPLHTLRANIDYAQSEASTTYGKIGVKVWIYKGEILGVPTFEEEDKAPKQTRKPNNNRPKREAKPVKKEEDKGGNSDVNAEEN